MTEGAKTGTPRTDKAESNFSAWHKRDDAAALRGSHLDSDDPKPPDGWKVARIIERDLTEALKVAGEAENRLALAINALKQIKALKEESFGDHCSSSMALKTDDVRDICDQALCAILPIDEVRKELAEQGISTDNLKDWASKRLAEVRAKKCTHDWELTWPNEPCEYTCKICGIKQQH